MDNLNSKDIKKALKIFWSTIVAISTVLFAGALILQLPQVQTAIGNKVLKSLSENLDGTITVEKIHLQPFTTLVLKNVVIIDNDPVSDPTDSTLSKIDTLFSAEYIIAKCSLEGLADEESIKIKSAVINNAQLNLVMEDKYREDGTRKAYNNLSRIFRIKKKEVKQEISPKEIFNIARVNISNMSFRLINRSIKKTPYHGGINWNDLDVSSIELTAEGLRFKDGIMYGNAESLSFKEKSGFISHFMSGDVRVGRGKTIIENLTIQDDFSDLHLPLYMMSYNNILDFNDFISRVRIDAEIYPSVVDFRTISFFAPQLYDNKLKATLSGTMSGYVDDFEVKDIVIKSHTGGFSTNVRGRIKGIPEVYDMWIDCNLNNLSFTPGGLGGFISEWIPEGEIDWNDYGKKCRFHGVASAKGYLNSMKVTTMLKSADGGLTADAHLYDLINPKQPIAITGKVKTDKLNLGKIINQEILGPTSISAGAQIIIDDNLAIDLDSLRVAQMMLNNYNYHDIQARGRIDSKSMNGTVISKDPNLNFIFQGGYARSEKSQNTVYKFNASVGHADLYAINVDKRGKSQIQFRTNANFTRTGRGDIFGRIDVGEILLENKGGRHDIGDIVVTSHSADNKFQARLNSKFAEGVYSGSASVVDFINDLKAITVKKELPALTADPSYVWNGHSYNFDFICHNVQNVLEFAVPGLYIENGTSIKASITPQGVLTASLNSNRVAFKRNYLKDLNISISNKDEEINGEMACSEISVATLKMNDNLLQLHINDNLFGAGYSFDNHSDLETKGEIFINGKVLRENDEPVLDIDIKPSSIHYNSKEWHIQPSDIRLYAGDIEIDSFGVISGEQTAGIYGKLSSDTDATIALSLERFDISILNALLPSDFGVKGIATGIAELKSPIDNMELEVDMICDSSYVANKQLGIVKIGSSWNDTDQLFDVFAYNYLNGEQNLNIDVKFTPGTQTVHADVNLNGLNVGYAQPFLKDVFSKMDGRISGNFVVDGTPKKLAVNGYDGHLNDCELKIGYTGVSYVANGPFHIDPNGVYFDDIKIKDRYNGTGTVYGSINYDHFKDITFDTRIHVNQIEAINLKDNEAEQFYGHLFGTGNIAITGPVNSIIMDIDATTEKAGQLHIPITSTSTSSKVTNLLKFKELDIDKYIDPYEIFVMKTNKEDVSNSDFLVRLKVNAQPDVEAFVEIDKASGNVLSGRGSGIISLEAGDDIFNINGDYRISSGNYKFVAMGLVSRDFKIQDGSSIRFNGDIMDSNLDINAIYRTKASISTLISDTTSVSNRRNVDCGISITDKLSNPQLSFSIDIPDLDPTIKSRVESALSTEDKIQKQFLALIISNNFLPDEQSGIVNNTSMLYSNVTEMMANQINNIFQKLDIPLDLGLNYQPNERGNDIFDVALTTQLFNNRVVVNGNIGNKQYSSGSTQNDVVGDIDIEIKLDRSGSFRLNLFSHSADQYTNYLDNSQRNGVGITYQTEFNSFRQFFRNIFSSKAKRQERRIAEERAAMNEDKVTIEIKPDNGK